MSKVYISITVEDAMESPPEISFEKNDSGVQLKVVSPPDDETIRKEFSESHSSPTVQF